MSMYIQYLDLNCSHTIDNIMNDVRSVHESERQTVRFPDKSYVTPLCL